MIANLILFAFAGIISKILLGCIAVWMLFPSDPECPACDADTVPLQDPAGLGMAYRVFRIQRRWCARCGEEYHARRARSLSIVMQPESEVPVTRV